METDPFGDPLPAGAVARFGTTRLWQATGQSGVESLAFAPDGRLMASAGIELPVVLWDAATGREVRRLGPEPPPPKDPYEPYFRVIGPFAFAPDGECLAVGRASAASIREEWRQQDGSPIPESQGVGNGLGECHFFGPVGATSAIAARSV
jgi:WD40 repeat protein